MGMTDQELEDNFYPAVLYYVSTGTSTRYFPGDEDPAQTLSDAVGIADWQGNARYMASWFLSSPTIPSNADLKVPDLQTVLDFFESTYATPYEIQQKQPLAKLTSAQISGLETTNIAVDSLIFNITDHKIQVYDGSDWLDV